MPELYFDDFQIGDRFASGGLTVTERAILDFARLYDPQPFHIDGNTAPDGPFGGLIASGIHTVTLSMALFFGLDIVQHAGLGSPGIDGIRWHHPLRPGDTIRITADVTKLHLSRSRPDRGVVWMDHETINQADTVIMTAQVMHMLRRRPALDGGGNRTAP